MRAQQAARGASGACALRVFPALPSERAKDVAGTPLDTHQSHSMERVLEWPTMAQAAGAQLCTVRSRCTRCAATANAPSCASPRGARRVTPATPHGARCWNGQHWRRAAVAHLCALRMRCTLCTATPKNARSQAAARRGAAQDASNPQTARERSCRRCGAASARPGRFGSGSLLEPTGRRARALLRPDAAQRSRPAHHALIAPGRARLKRKAARRARGACRAPRLRRSTVDRLLSAAASLLRHSSQPRLTCWQRRAPARHVVAPRPRRRRRGQPDPAQQSHPSAPQARAVETRFTAQI
jgi:hypothetical protein